jgi:thiol-disulfide isomerase/thioredoxin
VRAVKQILLLACLLGALPVFAQTGVRPATPRVVAYVEAALEHGDLASASALVAQYRRLNGDTPEALEAFSWVARGELAAGQIDQASKDADEIEHSCQTALATRSIDSEPHLALALGAAYEIQAEVLYRAHKRAEALQLLQTNLRKWRGTSLAGRLQKNINLLTLEGKPMPPLRETAWIGAKPPPETTWRGKVLLIFFWAHWCADCKAEAPVIAHLAAEFEPKGLVVVAPTRHYGYTAEQDNVPPAKETQYIERVFEKYYADIPKAQVPLDGSNFERFGASTTPTIVVVDRHAIVRLYHPGVMDEAALRAVIEPLLAPHPNERASR